MTQSSLTAKEVIELLQLAPLPGEGGFYRETYRSFVRVPQKVGGERSAGTCIYYLLTADTFSALHRLKTDEVYHFYRGAAVELTLLSPTGELSLVTLGSRFEAGQHCQWTVPAGTWQGSRIVGEGDWALLGTSMAPGFDFADCELAGRSLLDHFPEHAQTLETLLA